MQISTATRPLGRSKNLRILSEGGMTLIELLVGLAIVALMLGIVTTSLDGLFETNFKKTTARLSSTLKYLYNKAVTERLYLRVVFDLDEQSYWVESTSEVYVINPEVAQKAAEGVKEEEEEPETPPEDANFSKEESYLLKPVKLPEGIFFKDVQTSYLNQKVELGRAFLYFFPNGYATPTMINFRDEEDEINYSLEVKPYSGRVVIFDEYADLEKEAK